MSAKVSSCADCRKPVVGTRLRCDICAKKRKNESKKAWRDKQKLKKNLIVSTIKEETEPEKRKKEEVPFLNFEHFTLKPVNLNITKSTQLELFISIFEILKVTKNTKTMEDAFYDVCKFYKEYSPNYAFGKSLLVDKIRKNTKIKVNTAQEFDLQNGD